MANALSACTKPQIPTSSQAPKEGQPRVGSHWSLSPLLQTTLSPSTLVRPASHSAFPRASLLNHDPNNSGSPSTSLAPAGFISRSSLLTSLSSFALQYQPPNLKPHSHHHLIRQVVHITLKDGRKWPCLEAFAPPSSLGLRA